MKLAGSERLTVAALAALVALFCVLPVARLAFEAVLPGGRLDPRLALGVLQARSTWVATLHTLESAAVGTLIAVALGLVLALLVGLTDIRGKTALVFFALLPAMIPPQVTALAWAQLFGPSSPLLRTLGLAPPIGTPNPLYSAGGIMLLLGVQHAPLVFLSVRAGLRALPRDLVEAARACGASRRRVLLTVILPVMTPPLVAGAAIAFVSAVGNFGIPALLGIPAGYTVLPTLIYQRLAGFGPAIIGETAVLSILVGLVAFAGFAVQGLALRGRDYRLSGTGAPLEPFALGRWRPLAEALVVGLMLVIVAAPLLGLLATSLVPAYGVPLGPGTATLGNYAEVLFRQDVTVRAFRNSAALSLGAALVLALIAVPLGMLLVWRGSRLLRALSAAADIPYALPGIVLGIASILLFLKPLPLFGFSLYNTIWIIFFAYLARFLVLELRPIVAGLRQLDPALDEAARMTGAGFLFRLRTVILPLVSPMAAAGAILVFMTAFNELTVSALLWSAGNETLGVAVFNLDDSGNAPLASALASVTVVVILALMALGSALAPLLPRGALPWTK
ncbi:ABC transporter permease [Aureimonas ureilytica]|uniref:ABC transporter permease n=1 Tax=Aureimonas ureilytica TaxID=401562 RepID=UPI000370556E|nr:iron ABC transporter permease [Aureimonas ureilytica]